jgi:signal peptide peptidase SppA
MFLKVTSKKLTVHACCDTFTQCLTAGLNVSFALNLILNSQWAITEDALRSMIEVIDRRDQLEAIEKVRGERPKNVEKATVRGGVAIIPIRGPLFKRANLMTEHCGATSYEVLRRDFHQMLISSEVQSIILDIDSPGGEANGCSELADAIFEARWQKPIFAYVGGMGASAAYWIASACDRIFASDSAILGSIGVQSVMKSESQDGVIRFVSSQSPAKNRDPATEEGARDVQAVIDSLAEVFVQKVARNRGVDREAVLDRFGHGAVFVGKEAQKRGLIDEISTLENVIMGAEALNTGQEMTVESIKASHPALFEAIACLGAEKALIAERERISGIQNLPSAGVSRELLQKLILDGVSVPDAAIAILKESAQQRGASIAILEESEAKVAGVTSKPTTISPSDELEADLRMAAAFGIQVR